MKKKTGVGNMLEYNFFVHLCSPEREVVLSEKLSGLWDFWERRQHMAAFELPSREGYCIEKGGSGIRRSADGDRGIGVDDLETHVSEYLLSFQCQSFLDVNRFFVSVKMRVIVDESDDQLTDCHFIVRFPV